jgi:tetratricopeptide (TPR) repeat protein
MSLLQPFILWGLLLVLGTGAGWAATSNEIAVAVRDLGAKDFQVREKASAFLLQAGVAALPALKAAATSADPEVRTRVAAILPYAEFDLPADFPVDVATAVAGYSQSSAEEKQALVGRVLALGASGRPVLARLVKLEKDLPQRMEIFEEVLAHTVPPAMALTKRKPGDPQWAEGLAGLALVQTIVPEDVTLPLQLIRQFDERGLKKTADEVFERGYELLTAVIAAQPGETESKNALAWLCAVSRRQLDGGLKHIGEALKDQPERPDYLDTQAELLFQSGQRDAAITAIEKSIKLAPELKYFGEQLERFRKGDKTIPVPITPDELEIEVEIESPML